MEMIIKQVPIYTYSTVQLDVVCRLLNHLIFYTGFGYFQASIFANMTDDEKCNLKWKYIMERCAVSLAIMFVGKNTPVIHVLQLVRADMEEIGRRLPVY